jgi:uncharacterized protein
MIKKHYYSWQDVERACTKIALQMYADNWRPDYIVGITRGGNIPATILSNMLDIRCEALKVSLRDNSEHGSESNLWMAEDAFGYEKEPMKILIVDDINDTGATFNWIKKDWASGCLPDDPKWNTVWGNNVRFATITENLNSNFSEVNYAWHEVNKAEDATWLVYPWECAQ